MTGRARVAIFVWTALICGLMHATVASAQAVHLECVTKGYCLCITDELQPLIRQKVDHFLDGIRQAHADGKLVAYTSVPLSTGNGSYFGVNSKVAKDVADQLTSRFGRLWVVSPATPDADLPRDKAKQTDYMYMWSEVLFTAEQSANGFDLIYFSGPRDVAHALNLNGTDDLGTLANYYKALQKSDPGFTKLVNSNAITEKDFVSYYGLRASTSFSVGAHDEWNIVQKINVARRSKDGFTRQLPIFFDGNAVSMPQYQQYVMNGNVGACKKRNP